MLCKMAGILFWLTVRYKFLQSVDYRLKLDIIPTISSEHPKIPWPFQLTLIQILIELSLQNFAHDMTAMLSWHVQKFVVIQ